MSTFRIQRVQEEVQHALSSILLFEVGEPAFEKVTITRVLVTKDLGIARVYYDTRANDKERVEIEAAFERLRGYIRRLLASKLSIKKIPDLEFYFDEAGEKLSHVEALLASLQPPSKPKKT